MRNVENYAIIKKKLNYINILSLPLILSVTYFATTNSFYNWLSFFATFISIWIQFYVDYFFLFFLTIVITWKENTFNFDDRISFFFFMVTALHFVHYKSKSMKCIFCFIFNMLWFIYFFFCIMIYNLRNFANYTC